MTTTERDAIDPDERVETVNSPRRLYRSRRHRLIAGVAGGLAERFGMPVWLARLLWVLLFYLLPLLGVVGAMLFTFGSI